MKLTVVLLLASLGGLLSKCSSRCDSSSSPCKDSSCGDVSCSASDRPSVEVYNEGKEEKAPDNAYVNIDDLRKFSQEVKSASSKVTKAANTAANAKANKTAAKKVSAKKKHAKKKHTDDLVL